MQQALLGQEEGASFDRRAALAFFQSSSLPMLVQEEIERLIMTGELAVGSRVNESELATRFNTSRGLTSMPPLAITAAACASCTVVTLTSWPMETDASEVLPHLPSL